MSILVFAYYSSWRENNELWLEKFLLDISFTFHIFSFTEPAFLLISYRIEGTFNLKMKASHKSD